jgi:hypothetical protein
MPPRKTRRRRQRGGVGGNNAQNELYIASESGNDIAVKALLAAGADINKVNNNGETPLYIASQNGHTKVVEVLLAADADVNKEKNNGATPLLIASEKGHLEIVNKLLEKGAKLDKLTKDRMRKFSPEIQKILIQKTNIKTFKTYFAIFPRIKNFKEIIVNIPENTEITDNKDYIEKSKMIIKENICAGGLLERHVMMSIIQADFIVGLYKKSEDNENDILVSFAAIKIKDNLYIDTICSRPEYKNGGQLLLNYIHSLALENNIHEVSLNSVPESKNFYLKLGYTGTPPKNKYSLIPMKKTLQKAGKRFRKTLRRRRRN